MYVQCCMVIWMPRNIGEDVFDTMQVCRHIFEVLMCMVIRGDMRGSPMNCHGQKHGAVRELFPSLAHLVFNTICGPQFVECNQQVKFNP